MNFLGLAHYRLLAIDEDEKNISLQVELTTSPSCCAHCQSILLYRHEIKRQPFADLPMRGKPVRLIVHRYRYRCRTCNRTFFEDTPEMDEHHFITERLAAFIGNEALRRTFASIANDVGLDEWTIRSIFRESTAHLTDHILTSPVRYLGIDEVYLLGKPRCVLTDVEQRCILDLLRNRDKASVKNYLQRLPASLRDGITGVCMDGELPHLESRSHLQGALFEIWQADTRDQAQVLYLTWQRNLPNELSPAFHPLLTAMENWHTEIMAYFDHRMTNGPIEALNGLLKLAQRMGRGYSFEAIRAKVLLTGGLRLPRKALSEHSSPPQTN